MFERFDEVWEVSDKSVVFNEYMYFQFDLVLEEQCMYGCIWLDIDVWNDLQVCWIWCQFVWLQLLKDVYDLELLKKCNDGIDFDLYSYFVLLVFVIVIDVGFFKKIVDIDLLQNLWFWKLEDFVVVYECGGVL